jgi:enediyne biosynthesis protein E4
MGCNATSRTGNLCGAVLLPCFAVVIASGSWTSTVARAQGMTDEAITVDNTNENNSTITSHQDERNRFEDVSDMLIGFERQSIRPGTMGLAGVAWFDYDEDGDLDLFLPNARGLPNALFRNDGDSFINVADEAGVLGGSGGSGVLAADFDNDGFEDLIVAGDGGSDLSPVKVYRNVGDGTFEDVTERSGIVAAGSALSVVAADIDNDGLLDVYLAGVGLLNSRQQHASRLFRNEGDFTFADISESSGVGTRRGACAAIFSDYDEDGLIDLYVANCNNVLFVPTPIELFRNNGDGTFNDIRIETGLGIGGYWMGLAPADFDGDDNIDFFVTNLGNSFPLGALHALYIRTCRGEYTNRSRSAAVADFDFAWGTSAGDWDNDGDADILFTVSPPDALVGFSGSFDATGIGVLLTNDGQASFTNESDLLPQDTGSLFTSGLARGDFDGDGFEDVVIIREEYGNRPGTAVLWRNLGGANNWLAIDLVGTVSNRDAVGARVRVVSGGLAQIREVYAGASLASTESKRLLFGLGSRTEVDDIVVRWPAGKVERFNGTEARTTIMLVEGDGESLESWTVMNEECAGGVGSPLGRCGPGLLSMLFVPVGLYAVRRKRIQ